MPGIRRGIVTAVGRAHDVFICEAKRMNSSGIASQFATQIDILPVKMGHGSQKTARQKKGSTYQ